MRIKILIIGACISMSAFSKPPELNHSSDLPPYYSRRGFWKDNWVVSIGAAAGQETFLSTPKAGIYKSFPLIEGHDEYPFHPVSVFIGPELSMFVFFMGTSSVAINSGVNLGPITLDNSLTSTFVGGPSSAAQNFSYSTWNPKLGFAFGRIWIKAGPCYELGKKADWGNWLHINGSPWNFEIRFVKRMGN